MYTYVYCVTMSLVLGWKNTEACVDTKPDLVTRYLFDLEKLKSFLKYEREAEQDGDHRLIFQLLSAPELILNDTNFTVYF